MLTPLFVVTTFGIFLLVRNIFHPAFILMFFWSVGLVALALLPEFFFPSFNTQVVIYIYLSIFWIVSLIVSVPLRFDRSFNRVPKASVDTALLYSIGNLLALGLVIYIYRYVNVILNYSSLAEYFFQIRYAAIHLNEPLVVTGYFLTQIKTFASIFSVILLYETYKGGASSFNKIFLFCFIVLTLVANTIEGARNEVVYLLLAYGAVYVYLAGNKSIYKATLLFLSVFFFMSLLMRGISSGGITAIMYKFLTHLVMYAFGPIIAFDGFMEDGSIQVFSSIIKKFIDKLNGIFQFFDMQMVAPEAPSQASFTQIGDTFRINVYSFLAVRINYFGFIGAGVSIAMHAAIVTLIYKLKDRNIYLYILYILMIPTTILSLFHEYFLAMIPYYIRSIVLIFLLYNIRDLFIFKKGKKLF